MKKLKRRTFLKGSIGACTVAMGLPLLEIMFKSDSAFAASGDVPIRFGALYFPNGVIQQGYKSWFPVKQGNSSTNFSLNNSAFENINDNLRKYLTIFNGINNTGGSGNAHMQAISQFLTGHALSLIHI